MLPLEDLALTDLLLLLYLLSYRNREHQCVTLSVHRCKLSNHEIAGPIKALTNDQERSISFYLNLLNQYNSISKEYGKDTNAKIKRHRLYNICLLYKSLLPALQSFSQIWFVLYSRKRQLCKNWSRQEELLTNISQSSSGWLLLRIFMLDQLRQK